MTWLVAVLAVAVVAWFAAGTIWNIRKGSALMRWMQSGLPVLGGRTTVNWLGSTAVEMTIRDGKRPFSDVTLVIFLEARDLPWMWAIGRALGRRDTLIVRGVLGKTPDCEFEALDPASWSGRDAHPRVPAQWAARPAAGAERLVVHSSNERGSALAQALLDLCGRAHMHVVRLSLRQTGPHFQLHIVLPDCRQPAQGFFEAVRGLAERARA